MMMGPLPMISTEWMSCLFGMWKKRIFLKTLLFADDPSFFFGQGGGTPAGAFSLTLIKKGRYRSGNAPFSSSISPHPFIFCDEFRMIP